MRAEDTALRERLDAGLDRLRPEIGRILREYGVPLVGTSER